MSGKRKIESRWYAEIVCNLLCLVVMLAGGWLWLQIGVDDPGGKLADILLLYILVMLGAAEFIAFILSYILLIVFEKKAEKESNQGKWWVNFLFYEQIETDT